MTRRSIVRNRRIKKPFLGGITFRARSRIITPDTTRVTSLTCLVVCQVIKVPRNTMAHVISHIVLSEIQDIACVAR
jgi:hypothetical protein